ncbi:DHHC zinc finger domain containing protein [Plasmodium cynomolgi strain B]|uniref:Palmitoyltransferase n=1 Tax=Plasmodium cynomolgi (strain B) TaxID=1120755 RepID=K6UIK4_PLACD|nr:DHHC zinc finger domain containing protein [Plasmodium cynomolgi strain B]GAB65068.1 DHHC zinc finger domain containing protein [Plasmodium cynomolgi strain B]
MTILKPHLINSPFHPLAYVILEQYCPAGYDRIFSVLLFVSGVLSFLACSLSDPGRISHTSLDKHLKFYPYDEVIFHQNNICSTCQMLKPARSKHCKYCLSCISRYDHHCFLLNNCIGGYNSIYYLAFICTNATVAFHSFYITFRCLYNIIKYENLLKGFIKNVQDVLFYKKNVEDFFKKNS